MTTTTMTTTAAIRHRLGIAADPADVYDRLATNDGLRRWWTQDVRGISAVGDTLSFHFGGPDRSCAMEVRELVPDERVVWRCTAGPEEWVDTEFTFALSQDGADGETVLLFTNDGWREPVEFMHHCTTKWGTFLMSLKDLLETGRGRPAPDDLRISDWH